VRRPVTAADCRTCGACCGPPYVAPTYIDLTPLDLTRLTPYYRRRYVGRARGPALATTMTRDGSVCVALRGRLGVRVACAIYARRPGACRRFKPGSRACLRLRAGVGVPQA